MEVFLDKRGSGKIADEYKIAIKTVFPEIKEKQLPIGDITSGNVCIELKTIPDFLASITDGRFAEQPLHMTENFSHPLILVLGSFTDLFAENIYNTLSESGKGLFPNSIKGTIASIEARMKIPINFLEDINASNMLLHSKAKKSPLYPEYVRRSTEFIKQNTPKYKHSFEMIRYFIEKANDGKIPDNNPIRRAPTIKDRQIHTVASLVNISTKKAILLLNEFKTIQGVFNQTPESLRKVKGIGPKIANQIYEISIKEYEDD